MAASSNEVFSTEAAVVVNDEVQKGVPDRDFVCRLGREYPSND